MQSYGSGWWVRIQIVVGCGLSVLLCHSVLAEVKVDKPPSAAIASAHPLATSAGQQILRQGGNAFDAAITVSAVLAVVEPYGSGIGGGGFWLLHRARDQHQIMVDGREVAPIRSTPDMYLDDNGEPVPGLSINGPLAAGIPGVPAALAHIAKRYGRLPLATSLAPAIQIARNGFPVDAYYRRMAQFRLSVMRQSPTAAAQFLVDNQVPPLNYRLRQPDLAHTLQKLADHGAAGFYQGETAARLVQGVQQADGIWTLEDLATYRVVERTPIIGHYQGHRIVSAPPPSSGGIALVQMLQMLEHPPIKPAFKKLTTALSVTQVHLLSEVMRRVYRDRAHYLGDTDYVDVPISRLLNPTYNQRLAATIQLNQADRSVPLTEVPRPKGTDTTHFSILDQQGNRVAATLSINYPFGAGFVPPGTGVLLNNEMDDFASKPGAPNAYGLVGNHANAIAPGKRMLSSMTPTFIEHPRRIAILGTPGGSRIISMVLLGALQAIQGASVADWVRLPRFHHQYLPDAIQFEPEALTSEIQAELRGKGHTLQPVAYAYGNMQAILWDRASAQVQAASDPRGIGSAQVIQHNNDH